MYWDADQNRALEHFSAVKLTRKDGFRAGAHNHLILLIALQQLPVGSNVEIGQVCFCQI